MNEERRDHSVARRAIRISFIVGVFILAAKYLAWLATGSVALYSDALESIVNVVAAGAAWYAIHLAGEPADDNHHYGHDKAEYFSAVLEGGLVLVAAFAIVSAAFERLRHAVALDSLGLGFALSVAASVANGVLAAWLVRTGRREKSPALQADGMHLWTDVFTTAGVLIGLGLAWFTGLWILDPIVAILVALNIVRVAWGLIRGAIRGLMDEALPEDEIEAIHATVTEHLGAAQQAHDLRTRRAGRRIFIQFHLVVPARMTVRASHAICDEIEAALAARFGDVLVTIHVEPEQEAVHEAFAPPTTRR
ncbi:MAG: cation transporter [Deltaproteobacteria bacterium]|nr:cation transporter [Deltaproteobacteria bacterium]